MGIIGARVLTEACRFKCNGSIQAIAFLKAVPMEETVGKIQGKVILNDSAKCMGELPVLCKYQPIETTFLPCIYTQGVCMTQNWKSTEKKFKIANHSILTEKSYTDCITFSGKIKPSIDFSIMSVET